MEPLTNFHWGFMSLAIMRLYHYLILQPISFATNVNLNNTMCPAISDPFNGQWYRLAANFHQTFFIMLHGKLYIFIGNKFFVPKHSQPQDENATLKDDDTQHSRNYLDANGNNITKAVLNAQDSDQADASAKSATLRACNSCNASPSQKVVLNSTKED